ncbi:MAG: nucleotidyl transferase AbiEii/AbiGii toxin family protein [Candidatus Sumerlaeota bacterium]|nr:nucleotidyl transferase AbiEii/AbiGii toxin family protein [Candidatus Sumerlaeota bacterium]
MRETLPLATLQSAVLEFLQKRDDVVVFGAQAVNAYVNEARMTQYIDLVTTRPDAIAQELRDYLRQRFHIAVRERQVGAGQGIRLFQARKAGNRRLVDIRPVATLPRAKRIAGILVMAPEDLIAAKVIAYHQRRGQPKSGTDWRDIAMLLLTFPALKTAPTLVADRLRAAGASPEALAVWKDLAAQEIRAAEEDEGF